jgi:YYY domain-containing protein
MGLVVGALRATNTWDFPTYLLVSLAAVGVLEASRRLALPFPAALDARLAFLLRAAVAVIWRMVILVAVSSLAFYPYTRYYATAYAGLQLWREKTTTLADYITVWGFFLALTVIYLISEWIVQARERRRPAWLDNLLPAIAAAAIVLMLGGWLFKLHVWLVAVPLAAMAGVLALGRDLPPARRLALLLFGLALAITMGVEVVRQKDDIGRMNTVFKFYMQAWVLFGVATAFGLASWAARAITWRPDWRRLAWGVTGVLFAGVMLFPVTAAPAKIRDRFSAEASPRGLDGMAYMDRAKYFDNNRELRLDQDKDAILWLLRNVEGSPVILEAQTPEYRWGSRFSIYTGLPTVQGWNWHQKQQRSVVPGTAIDRRVADVREIYETLDLARAQKLLNYYGVSYIIVGELERAYYNPAGLAKFDVLAQQGYLRPVYTNGVVTIYRVVRPGAPVAGSAPATGVGPRPVPTPTPAVRPFISPQR